MSRSIRPYRDGDAPVVRTAYLRGIVAYGHEFASGGVHLMVSRHAGSLYVEDDPRDCDPDGFYRFDAVEAGVEPTMLDQIRHIQARRIDAAMACRALERTRRVDGVGPERVAADRTELGLALMDLLRATEEALRLEFDEAELEGLRSSAVARTDARLGTREEVVA